MGIFILCAKSMGCTTIKSDVNFANLNVYNPGLGSIQTELELINSIPVPVLERELELKDLEQNELNWN